MSSDLHGPPAGPRRPGIMIFKCVEFLIQLKNKNSSYWLSHITTARNCKIYLIFLSSIVCHMKNMIKKYMGENVKKKYVFQQEMKIGSFATFLHIVIETTCMMDLFDIPLCGKKLWYIYFLLYFLGNNMLHRPPSGPPRPGSLLMLHHFLFTCSIFFFILPFVLIITEINNQIAMRKSIHYVVDVQSLGSKHQMSMLHYWIFYIRITAHEKFTYCSEYSACCS